MAYAQPLRSFSVLQRETAALIAPQFVGSGLSLILYGVYIVLQYQYAKSDLYRRLSWPVKATLVLVCFLVTAYEIVQYADTMYWAITVKRTPDDIFTGVPLDSVIPLLGAVVAAPVQILLIVRAASLLRHRWTRSVFLLVGSSLILAALTGAILTCATGIMYFNDTIDNILPFTYNDAVSLWLWSAATCDVCISLCLACTLHRRIQGFNANTDSLLRKLIKSALRTAAYTAILAVGGAAVASATPDTDYTSTFAHFAFWFPLPPCYALSLFTTLSARRTIDAQLAPPSESPASPRRKVAPPATASVKQQRATIDYNGLRALGPERPGDGEGGGRVGGGGDVREEGDGTDESTKREKETVTRWREEQNQWTLSLEKAAAPHGDEEDDELEEWERHGRSRRGVV
ncbi:proteophosphoglycan ppg4 [Rhodotorula toruloides]|uniref:Proteophosphoglycan ppg4 n=1 Tax=Rhodotorula toruloides TaxID=5286 RepID=A0A511KC89_RHOTO|nr:proteophosphoglycan ppg4 [Rhodotorula toruloides]